MVLKYDDLIVGTAMGLFSYLPTSSVTPTPTVTPTLSPLPTPSPTPATVGKISGSVLDIQGTAVESVKLTLKGVKTKYSSLILSEADGSFEFADLKADTYVITAKKKGYKKARQKVKLAEGEEKTEVKIELRKLKKVHFRKVK